MNTVSNVKFACSKDAGRWLYGKNADSKYDITIINNAIDTEKFIFNPEVREKYRKDLGISGKFVIGHIGRFSPQKNHGFLIDIFSEVVKKNNDSVLLLVGDGELRGEISQKIDKLGLSKNVILTGIRSDIPQLLWSMDAFVLPSLYEGFPVVGIEAQAAGLPCFFSDQITAAAKITQNVHFINLLYSPGDWACEIIQHTAGYVYPDTSAQLKASGFDVKEATNRLQELYLGDSLSMSVNYDI
jgi:glycosyltransferase involved in cell wall biosynthesis